MADMAESLNGGVGRRGEYDDARGSHLGGNRACFLTDFVISILDVAPFRPVQFVRANLRPRNSTITNAHSIALRELQESWGDSIGKDSEVKDQIAQLRGKRRNYRNRFERAFRANC